MIAWIGNCSPVVARLSCLVAGLHDQLYWKLMDKLDLHRYWLVV